MEEKNNHFKPVLLQKQKIQEKESSNQMEQEISRLTEGQEFKSMKDLFEFLNLEYPSGGTNRMSAINHLKRWIRIEDIESTNKKVVAEVYDHPLDLPDGRKEGNHNIYKKYLKIILLNSLLLRDNFEVNYTYAQFWTEMGMCNKYYTDKDMKKRLLSVDHSISEEQMDEFFRRSWSIMKNITDSVLESLVNEGMLEFTKSKLIKHTDNETAVPATKEERKKIGSEETRVMKQMGFKNKKELFLARKNKEYRVKVRKALQEKYGWENYFECFNILAYDKDVLEKGLEDNIKDLKKTLNNNILQRVKKNAAYLIEQETERIKEDYEEYKQSFALGTPESFEEYYKGKAFNLFQEQYADIQDLLADCFIADTNTLLERIRSIELDTKEIV